MYADGADQPFHSLPDLIGDKYVLEMSELTEVVMKDDVVTLYLIWRVFLSVCVQDAQLLT